MATFIHEGDSVDYTPEAAVTAGDVIRQGNLIGVAASDIAAGELGALAVSGVFTFTKDTGSSTAITAGATVYWDYVNEVATTESSGNIALGKCVTAATDDDETVLVRLSQ